MSDFFYPQCLAVCQLPPLFLQWLTPALICITSKYGSKLSPIVWGPHEIWAPIPFSRIVTSLCQFFYLDWLWLTTIIPLDKCWIAQLTYSCFISLFVHYQTLGDTANVYNIRVDFIQHFYQYCSDLLLFCVDKCSNLFTFIHKWN